MSNLFYQPLISEGIHFLDAEESRHCIRVLRRKSGDTLVLTDGKGYFYDAVITEPDASRCAFEVRDRRADRKKDYFIHIAISPTKNSDRTEWFVEKATELGADEITLMACHRSERSVIRPPRLRKVAVSAMKQSFNAVLPHIADRLVPFGELVAQPAQQHRFIASVDASNPRHLLHAAPKNSSYLVLIGPEGDFTDEELTHAEHQGFQRVSLGSSRLRTETAGLAAAHILNLVHA